MMKYTIYYSVRGDIYRYKMNAKDENQLIKFLSLLTEEEAYNFQVEVYRKWKKIQTYIHIIYRLR